MALHQHQRLHYFAYRRLSGTQNVARLSGFFSYVKVSVHEQRHWRIILARVLIVGKGPSKLCRIGHMLAHSWNGASRRFTSDDVDEVNDLQTFIIGHIFIL